jgi:LmbE family N-acetylglucosaminyl deacetylase
MKNILFVGAHPDDLEVMAGGTIKHFIDNGCSAHVITLTNGSWTGKDGKIFRDNDSAKMEADNASKVIGYTIEYLNEKIFEIQYKDKIVLKILDSIDNLKIDTLICPWLDDLHIDHRNTARMAISASRKVKRVWMAQGNWYISNKMFCPNIFIDITKEYEFKMKALECYKEEMKRTGDKWRSYHDAITRYYGLISGVKRAEGFISHKTVYE